jgi:hypothetical protein
MFFSHNTTWPNGTFAPLSLLPPSLSFLSHPPGFPSPTSRGQPRRRASRGRRATTSRGCRLPRAQSIAGPWLGGHAPCRPWSGEPETMRVRWLQGLSAAPPRAAAPRASTSCCALCPAPSRAAAAWAWPRPTASCCAAPPHPVPGCVPPRCRELLRPAPPPRLLGRLPAMGAAWPRKCNEK